MTERSIVTNPGKQIHFKLLKNVCNERHVALGLMDLRIYHILQWMGFPGPVIGAPCLHKATVMGHCPHCTGFMMTSSNGNIFRVTGPLCGEFTCPGEIPAQRPVTRSSDVFFDLRQNKRLSKQLWGRWFETLSRPLWHHRNAESKVHLS